MRLNFVILLGGLFLNIGCAGPVSPFGGMSFKSLNHKLDFFINKSQKIHSQVHFEITPKRQVMHKSSDISLKINDSLPIKNHKLLVFYNGRDVTDKMLDRSSWKYSTDGHSVAYKIKKAYISSRKSSEVVFVFDNGHGKHYFEYKKPSCDFRNKYKEMNVSYFDPPEYMMKYIKKWALYYNYNPNFIASIIAQESRFNPKAVSWAKAMGLMQVTPIADRELQGTFKNWPRHSKVESLPVPALKMYVFNGNINEENDWRLEADKSIRGGINYFRFIEDYWQITEHRQLLKDVFGTSDDQHLNVMMASYNSGASRVKRALMGHSDQFLNAPALKEARNYVNRINSYCYSFNGDK